MLTQMCSWRSFDMYWRILFDGYMIKGNGAFVVNTETF